ncbi:hypothetical protein [Streptomyces halstedii]|uniref:Uncharacterized protein n=1 Tax=Streptomyces halstedii TaxID=1944 RepID=A0A6N9U6K8_STRHA|nr:hypothetical protein [Streptomyces halstedii]NEA17556.1 hypothetical protein [Streptomyces halstedii]
MSAVAVARSSTVSWSSLVSLGVPVRLDRGRQAHGLGGTDSGELGTGQTGTHQLVRVQLAVAVTQSTRLEPGSRRKDEAPQHGGPAR